MDYTAEKEGKTATAPRPGMMQELIEIMEGREKRATRIDKAYNLIIAATPDDTPAGTTLATAHDLIKYAEQATATPTTTAGEPTGPSKEVNTARMQLSAMMDAYRHATGQSGQPDPIPASWRQ